MKRRAVPLTRRPRVHLGDTGELTHDADRPIVGTCIPWEMCELNANTAR